MAACQRSESTPRGPSGLGLGWVWGANLRLRLAKSAMIAEKGEFPHKAADRPTPPSPEQKIEPTMSSHVLVSAGHSPARDPMAALDPSATLGYPGHGGASGALGWGWPGLGHRDCSALQHPDHNDAGAPGPGPTNCGRDNAWHIWKQKVSRNPRFRRRWGWVPKPEGPLPLFSL